MDKVLFASDLDNTLLFSWKHRQASDRCVEYLEGREQGFCTQRSLELLALVRERALFIPVTTRSAAQYQRIVWPAACAPKYAAAANGGLLLVDGQIDPEWRARTEQLAAPWREELLALECRLPEVPVAKRSRIVDGLYLFAACDNGADAGTVRDRLAGGTALEAAVSGRKVYFFPPPLNKGEALRRLEARFRPDRTICAGDSVIDLPMLRAAGLAIIPSADILPEKGAGVLCLPKGRERFPDFVLRSVLNELSSPEQSRKEQE